MIRTKPPRRATTVPAVMRAKLAHAQAILEGIALGDYAEVETNAMALKRISQGADWLAHESAAYFDFSAEFRDSCDDLVHHSQAKNVKALVQDYGTLTTTCVACHEYLRKERQTKDMPGRVSLRSAGRTELRGPEDLAGTAIKEISRLHLGRLHPLDMCGNNCGCLPPIVEEISHVYCITIVEPPGSGDHSWFHRPRTGPTGYSGSHAGRDAC